MTLSALWDCDRLIVPRDRNHCRIDSARPDQFAVVVAFVAYPDDPAASLRIRAFATVIGHPGVEPISGAASPRPVFDAL